MEKLEPGQMKEIDHRVAEPITVSGILLKGKSLIDQSIQVSLEARELLFEQRRSVMRLSSNFPQRLSSLSYPNVESVINRGSTSCFAPKRLVEPQ